MQPLYPPLKRIVSVALDMALWLRLQTALRAIWVSSRLTSAISFVINASHCGRRDSTVVPQLMLVCAVLVTMKMQETVRVALKTIFVLAPGRNCLATTSLAPCKAKECLKRNACVILATVATRRCPFYALHAPLASTKRLRGIKTAWKDVRPMRTLSLRPPVPQPVSASRTTMLLWETVLLKLLRLVNFAITAAFAALGALQSKQLK